MFAARKTEEVRPAAPNTQIQSDPYEGKGGMLVREIIAHYMKDRRNKLADRPCKSPESLEAHFKPLLAVWGDWTLADFRKGAKGRVKEQVQEWRRDNLPEDPPEREPLKVGTCRKRISQLKTAFKFCVEDELIPVALMPIIKLPMQGAPRERTLTLEELAALLREVAKPSTQPHIRLAFHIAIRTGQRQSAIKALEWSHVDFENRVINFRDTEAAEDRSKKRRTNLPMCQDLYEIMLDAYENRDEECARVVSWHGRPVKNLYGGFKALYKRAGVENLHLHDLRRAAATFVHAATNGNLKAAASFLGDTEIMAQRHYVHAAAETLREPVDALSAFIRAAQKGII